MNKNLVKKENAMMLAAKFGLKKDEAEEIYEGINKTIKTTQYAKR